MVTLLCIMYVGLHRKVIKCQHGPLLMKETIARLWWYKQSLFFQTLVYHSENCALLFFLFCEQRNTWQTILPKLHWTQILGKTLARTSGHNSYIYIKRLEAKQTACTFFPAVFDHPAPQCCHTWRNWIWMNQCYFKTELSTGAPVGPWLIGKWSLVFRRGIHFADKLWKWLTLAWQHL